MWLLDPRRDAVGRGAFADTLHMEAQNIGEGGAGARQLLGQHIGAGVGGVADDEALIGVEHREAAAHVIERGFEAGVELLELLVALHRLEKLLLEPERAARHTAGAVAGSLRLIIARRLLSARIRSALEGALTHNNVQNPRLSVRTLGNDRLYITNRTLTNLKRLLEAQRLIRIKNLQQIGRLGPPMHRSQIK